MGRGTALCKLLFCNGFSINPWLLTPPTSVGFMARAAPYLVEAALAKNLTHRSRENEFTDGRVWAKKTRVSFRTTTGLNELRVREERPQSRELSRLSGHPLPHPLAPCVRMPSGLETSRPCGRGRAGDPSPDSSADSGIWRPIAGNRPTTFRATSWHGSVTAPVPTGLTGYDLFNRLRQDGALVWKGSPAKDMCRSLPAGVSSSPPLAPSRRDTLRSQSVP